MERISAAELTLLFKNEQFGHAQFSQFDRTIKPVTFAEKSIRSVSCDEW